MKRLIPLLALLGGIAYAQPQPGQIWITSSSAPSGACTATYGVIVIPTGLLYTCQSGMWAQVSGSGGGTPASPTGSIQINAGGGNFGPIIPGTGIATALTVAPDAATGLSASPSQVTVTPSGGVATYGSASLVNLFNFAALTANVTSSVAPTGQSVAKPYIFHVPVTSGTPTMAWPASFIGFPPLCPDASSSTNILAWFDGVNTNFLTASNTTGHGCVTEGADPSGTPGAGMGFPFFSSRTNSCYKNSSGSILCMGLVGGDYNPTTGIISKLNGVAFGTSATVNTGTSGATIPLLSTANTWTLAQTMSTPLAVASGGTGTATPALIPGTNVTISGSWPNQTINSTGGGGGSGTPALSNVTAVTANANSTSPQQLQEIALTAGYLNTAALPVIFHSSGIFSTTLTPTVTLTERLCTVSGCGSGTVIPLVVIVSTATTTGSNNQFSVNFACGTKATGATGNLICHGFGPIDLTSASVTSTVFSDGNTAVSSNIDLTAALYFDTFVTFSSGSTSNTMTDQFSFAAPQGAGGSVTSVICGTNLTGGTITTTGTCALATTVTGTRITPRIVTAADGTTITPNTDNADVTYQSNSQAAGTLTIAVDGGTPTNGQVWKLKINACVSSGGQQTYSWNTLYVGGTDVALPTVTSCVTPGTNLIDTLGFIYDTVKSKWELVAVARGY